MIHFYNSKLKILCNFFIIFLLIYCFIAKSIYFIIPILLILTYFFFVLISKPKVTILDEGFLINYFIEKEKFIYFNEIKSFYLEERKGLKGHKRTTITINLVKPKKETSKLKILLNELFIKKIIIDRVNYYNKIILRDYFLSKNNLNCIYNHLYNKLPYLGSIKKNFEPFL